MLAGPKLHLAFFFAILFLFIQVPAALSNTTPQQNIIPLNNWQYVTESQGGSLNPGDLNAPQSGTTVKWQRLSSTTDILKFHAGEIIWLKTKLPDWEGDHPAIYLGNAAYNMQVFLNDKMIYQVDDFDSRKDKYIRWHQVLIDLPDYKKGDDLIVKIRPGDKTAVNFENIILGSSEEIIRSLFRSSFITLLLIALMFITAAAAVIVYFTLMRANLLIYLTIFLLAAVVLISVNNSFLQMIINMPALFYNLNYIFLNAGSVVLFLMIELIVLKKYKLIINIIWKFKLAFMFFTIALLNMSDLIFNDLLKYFLITSIISILIATVTILLSTSKGRYESRILYMGVSAIYLSSIIEIILINTRGITNTFGYSITAMPYGFLLFVGSILWYAAHNYLQTIREKEESKHIEFEAVKRENETRFLFTKKLIDSQENERNRIALELHDSVGQKLLLVKNMILSRVKKSSEDMEKNFLYRVSDLTQETVNEIRNIIYNLRPQHLDQLGLSTAIETLVESLSSSSGINFVLNMDKIDDHIKKPDEINFFRILQEFLNNVVKHSNAKDAFIDILKEDGSIIMRVKDNGKSSKGNGRVLKGMGLVGVRERSQMIGAELNLDINGEDGTTVILKYPVKQKSLQRDS